MGRAAFFTCPYAASDKLEINVQSLQPPSEVLTKILALSEISKDSKCEDAIHARNQLNREDLYLAQREVISFQIQLLHYELPNSAKCSI